MPTFDLFLRAREKFSDSAVLAGVLLELCDVLLVDLLPVFIFLNAVIQTILLFKLLPTPSMIRGHYLRCRNIGEED
jgi:hypothetical protein